MHEGLCTSAVELYLGVPEQRDADWRVGCTWVHASAALTCFYTHIAVPLRTTVVILFAQLLTMTLSWISDAV
jgi:hypothetical protein